MDDACALIAVRLGYTEEQINNMAIPFFNDVLKMLGRVLNWEKLLGFAGNSFAKDLDKALAEAHPMVPPSKIGSGLMSLINGVNLGNAADLGDISWAT